MGPLLSVCCRVTLSGSCVGTEPLFLGSMAVRWMVSKECCKQKCQCKGLRKYVQVAPHQQTCHSAA